MNAGKTIFAFWAGAAAGAVAALLMAPDSGENTRAKIREGLDELETALEKE